MVIVTPTALPIIILVAGLIVLAILLDLIRFRKLPFKLSFKATKYNRSLFNAADIVFKLSQWSLFIAVVTVAGERTESVTLSIMSVVLSGVLVIAIYNVLWSVIEARITFQGGSSTLSNLHWKVLLFCLVMYPILDIQSLMGRAVVDFVKNANLH